jgi:hypothetical protein
MGRSVFCGTDATGIFSAVAGGLPIPGARKAWVQRTDSRGRATPSHRAARVKLAVRYLNVVDCWMEIEDVANP